MIMLGGYSYLGLIGHPQINAAAKAAIEQFGTGTYGVRLLAGSLTLHDELEARIAAFKKAEAAITISSGYVTNRGHDFQSAAQGRYGHLRQTEPRQYCRWLFVGNGRALSASATTTWTHLEQRLQEARTERP